MTVTVSTSIDPAGGGAAAVTVDVTMAVQAARAFAAQAKAFLAAAQQEAQAAANSAADAQAALDQAQGLYSLTVSKIGSQLTTDALEMIIKGLPTAVPSQAGKLYLSGGFPVLSS